MGHFTGHEDFALETRPGVRGTDQFGAHSFQSDALVKAFVKRFIDFTHGALIDKTDDTKTACHEILIRKYARAAHGFRRGNFPIIADETLHEGEEAGITTAQGFEQPGLILLRRFPRFFEDGFNQIPVTGGHLVRPFQVSNEPGTGELPVTPDGFCVHANYFGNFDICQTAKAM